MRGGGHDHARELTDMTISLRAAGCSGERWLLKNRRSTRAQYHQGSTKTGECHGCHESLHYIQHLEVEIFFLALHSLQI